MSDCPASFWGTVKHDWSKWVTYKEANLVDADTRNVIGIVIIQKRTCQRCGFVETDKQEQVI